ncbi:MAG: UDP-N-acetylglucosamine 2-epimerase [Parcubacteria group bacterium Athens1014_10]|nr:MAG: UDP-N-acetylglucosamine 2-epimerase [Parcubacteria group bacterium Athens1014_10]TSD05561.1 MAG: UDP-N-acetylglucosamine 2-epimerase [Parcubacteria group bacterium Athens0714_12]
MLDNYGMMFGDLSAVSQREFYIKSDKVYVNEKIINQQIRLARKQKSWVLLFVIGTKPCFYKFYGSIMEAKKQNLPYIIIDSNQHYDKELTFGKEEFGYKNEVGIHLSIKGDLVQKAAELLLKFKWISDFLNKKDSKINYVPVVLGDTIMTSIVPMAWMFSRNQKVIQNEAGLRSMYPLVLKEYNKISIPEFINKQFYGKWELCTNEPFPEQWDTFVSAAGSQYLFVPTKINKEHLIREGYNPDRIFITGGVVIDALNKKLAEKPSRSIFDVYPQLKFGQWIRADIHRRGNLTERRFLNIINCLELLIKNGYNINFIEMNATKFAINKYGLRNRLIKLARENKNNFLFTPIWREYAQAIEFYKSSHCLAALTDSGGIQEEMNLLNKICLTCRFSTERPETVNDAHSNIIVPPVDGEFMFRLVDYILNNQKLKEKMQNSKKVYGKNVAKKFINIISELSKNKNSLFNWTHEEIGLWREKDKGVFL